MRTSVVLWTLILWASSASVAAPGNAFYNAEIGNQVENLTLDKLTGGRQPFLGDADANVFLFFRPDQENSRAVLKQMTALALKLGDKRVAWVAVVSDAYAKEAVAAAVAEAGLTMPVLIDKGDALYGKLGVVLHPVIGIADKQHKLVAYEPFHKIDYAVIVEARIKRLLGLISDAELAAALNPPQAVDGGDKVVAKRHLKMAEMLFAAKSYDKALEFAAKSLAHDPEAAGAHGLVALILATRGDCAGAKPAIDAALKLDAKEARALAAKEMCAKAK
ncbi:MAG: hypothetical protein HY903_11590 [Deltaproteobacteria bacterium]|nr:hypothetical protein [Deltaproteobacteria bacterium]